MGKLSGMQITLPCSCLYNRRRPKNGKNRRVQSKRCSAGSPAGLASERPVGPRAGAGPLCLRTPKRGADSRERGLCLPPVKTNLETVGRGGGGLTWARCPEASWDTQRCCGCGGGRLHPSGARTEVFRGEVSWRLQPSSEQCACVCMWVRTQVCVEGERANYEQLASLGVRGTILWAR